MNTLELNSPAGDIESLKAAVYNGADSVYLGTKFFNARRLAGNFSAAELTDAVMFAHLHGVQVYLTLNTLVRDEEVSFWFTQLEEAYLAGIDGVIIQELFFAPFIKKFFPGLRIHASTQASLMNFHGISQFPEIDQVVLARELTKDEIKTIRSHTKKRLEMFVHGHLCISYSGQCLISSLIGKRSGNRGICASSCRKSYNDDGYLISAKDLMLANNINDILDAGIDVIKIEGRMKTPAYVGTTTRFYRQQIDSIGKKLSPEETTLLASQFNRDFTTGFFMGNESIVGKEMPMNRGLFLGTVRDKKLVLQHDLHLGDGVGFWNAQKGKLEGFVLRNLSQKSEQVQEGKRGESVFIPSKHFKDGARVFLTSKKEKQDPQRKDVGFPLSIIGLLGKELVFEGDGKKVSSSVALQESKTQPLTKDIIEAELMKSEEWGIRWDIHIFMLDPDLFLPISGLRKLRKELERVVLEKGTPKRTSHREEIRIQPSSLQKTMPKLIVKVYTLDQVREANSMGVHAIYYDVFDRNVAEAKKLCTHSKLFLDTPVVITDTDIERIEDIIKKVKPHGIVIGNWGLLGIPFSGEKHGKFSLNIFNDVSLIALRKKGIIPTVSVELNAKQAVNLQQKDFIYYAHGHIPVMHFKGEFRERSLTDEVGYTFPLRVVNGNTEMLYSRPIALYENILELVDHGVHYFLLDLNKDVSTIIQAYQNILAHKKQDITMLKKGTTIGNFVKGVA